MTTQASVIDTPAGMEYMGYATLKSQFRMEKIGLKHSAMKGKALRPMWAKHFGLKVRDDHDVYIAACQKRMDELLSKKAS